MRADEKQFGFLIRRMRADDSVDAPVEAIKFVKNVYRTRIMPKASLVQRIKAFLVSDLLPDKLVMGERSGSSTGPRQVLFDAGEYAIDLRISADHDSFTIKGQILGFGFENGHVYIGRKRATIDVAGQFELQDVRAGSYEIVARRGDIEITVEDFTLE